MIMKTNRKTLLLAATGLVAAMACAPALAEDKPADTKAADTKVENGQEVVIVRGVRGSVKDASDKKRRNRQISDSVSAEDAGKLPDNNATEALAHVTGVQITRQHGEGSDMAIRGMQEVGTTINGNAAGGGNLRSLNHNAENGGTCNIATITGICNDQGPTLSDVPAALIKSVTIYKTRTPDQIEGGIAGTVDVELRRPLDLPKKLTVAGSYRDVFSNIGNTESPNASLLVADRWDTPLGQMGLLANIGYSKNNYEEQHLVSESVGTFYAGTYNGNPASSLPYVGVYKVWNGVQTGSNKRPSLNLTYQWRPNDNLDLVLETFYSGSRENAENNYLALRTRGDGNPTFTNLVLQPDGKSVKSFTMTTTGTLPLDIVSSYWQNKNDTTNTNFEANWHNDKLTVVGKLQYSSTDVVANSIYQVINLNGLHSASVDLDSSAVDGGAPQITLQPGYDFTNSANYVMANFHNQVDHTVSRDFNGQVDATYRLSDDGLLRSFKSGVRMTSHFSHYYTAYRDSLPTTPPAISAFPTGTTLVSSSVDTPGFPASKWYHLDNQALLANFNSVLSYLNNSAHSTQPQNWAPVVPFDNDRNSNGDKEFTTAYYGQFEYGFNLIYPIDGIFGARAVSTKGTSFTYTFNNGTPKPQPDFVPGKYFDVMPSLNTTVHFDKNFQLRLAYTYNVQRPAFQQLNGGLHIDYDGTGKATGGWGGNPNLKPMKGPNYDASLEYYFGRGGVASFAAYLKEPDGTFFAYQTRKSFPPDIPNDIQYWTTYNAGKGTFQGYEFNVQGFFDFLPGFWHNFGGGFNYTYNQIYKIVLPSEVTFGSTDASYTSKKTMNIQLYYDTPQFNARVAYNYRSKFRFDPNLDFLDYTIINAPTSRLDVSLAWTPKKWLTLTLEGTNLLNDNQKAYYGYEYYPEERRLQARTIQVGARFRY